ncbi:hypothetical protein [Streptomyces sp. NPDC002547]
MKIQVVACDVDKEVPALTYTITASDGRELSVDLCEVHGGPIEALFKEFGQDGEEPEAQAEEPAQVKKAPAPRKATPAKKVPAAKKTASGGRRRTRVMTLEEIEQQKKS